jgi:dTDP-glucose 4,6-dehydratase
VEGFLKIADVEEAIGQVVNLGSGATTTIGDLAKRIFALLGKTPVIVTDAHRTRPEKSEVLRLHAANQKAQELMGWRPGISLETGLKLTIKWISHHMALYQPDQYAV